MDRPPINVIPGEAVPGQKPRRHLRYGARADNWHPLAQVVPQAAAFRPVTQILAVLGKQARRKVDHARQAAHAVVWHQIEHGGSGTVAENGIAHHQFRLMTGENGGCADLDSNAENGTFPAAGQHAGSGLEIRNRRAAPHPHQVLEANRRLEPQVFRDIRGETRAEVAGAGVDDQAGYLNGWHPSLRQRAACGGDGCGTAELEKARQPPVGISFEGIRLGLYPQIPALNLTVQENAAIQILFGRFQVEVRVEEFVGLLLRYIEWGGGGAQTSENGLQEFAPGLNRVMAAASAGSQSGRSRNFAAVARDSNTPEASRYHGIVQFGVLSQHLAAVLGRDRNGLRRNPLAIATSLAVQGGAVTVEKTVQEAIRDVPRLHPNRTLWQRREHALQARQFGQRFQSQRIHLPRLPEVTQSPERFLTDRFLEAIRQQQSGQIAIEAPLAVGFDAPQQFRRRNPSFEKLESRVTHRFIGG